jgi:hypothetical protein
MALDEDPDGPDGIRALPGLARIAFSASLRTTEWTMQTSIRASRRIVRAALSAESASDLAQDVRSAARELVLDLLEIADIEQRMPSSGAAGDVAKRVAEIVPLPTRRENDDADDLSDGRDPRRRSLQEQGELLLRRSRDVHYEFEAHPAYERILSELAPDEARILRLLLLDGPQPAVDIRTGGPLGLLRSRLIAPGLSMIGARAGCRYVERVPSYLNNLFRLGMVWFSRETLRDPLRYQVLEAQPEVLEAIHSVAQAKVVRRSIHLTPFGEDFCRMTLCPETVIAEDLPEHSAPPDNAAQPTPPQETTAAS